MTAIDIESPRGPANTGTLPPQRNGSAATREVRHEYTHSFPALLSQLGVSVLVSTYQAGKVVAVGVQQGALTLAYHNFERAMGLAVTPDGLAVGARAQVWFLESTPELAAQMAPAGRHDACFLTRSSHFTGEVQAHELAWAGEELWLVNTAFSCLCTLDRRHSFVPRWKPPFITALAAEDRCHLNGLALAPGERGVLIPRYVTALAETDTPEGWRPDKAKSGCLIDVASGQTVARGFAMPHSPRVHRGHAWLLHSGAGQLVQVDPASGKTETVTELPGYTRGLALHEHFAFIGLSKIRETSTFGGMPITERRPELKCGVGVVDLRTGRLAAHLEFVTGVEEIFDVQVLPGVRCPALSGPYSALDGGGSVWMVPQAARAFQES
jgi:uncharacterized protein (TIGR03032 family)